MTSISIENNFPQREVKDKLVDLGAKFLDNSTYLYLDLNNKRGIYELTFEGKKDNKDYILRRIIDTKK